MSQQITVTRALAHVKSLNDRIERATNTSFVSFTTGGKHNTGKSEQEIASQLKANLQSVTDLIKTRAKVKAAIVRSNANTKVNVSGVEMTVAEAIERKGSIQFEVALLNNLRQQLSTNTAMVERQNVQMQARLDDLIKTAAGKDRKVDEAEIKAITDPFERANRAVLLNPNDLSNFIEALEKDIADFVEEVDFALSEVNAITKIDV
ncbi:hypothetical protein vBPpSSYP_160 [Pseudomonas phage vB_PpS_SYP]|nr:hypothetical protein vBPpSSYP_160 [Pseudomonas phage vB_PpS_SYP]